ncbi:MAG: hypothetical protein KGZ88_08620 [Methylomicrobium sp.]|nr:hypothetical protein [Methylomicrobium sp.]
MLLISVKIPTHGKTLTAARLTGAIFLAFQSPAMLRIISELSGLNLLDVAISIYAQRSFHVWFYNSAQSSWNPG